MDRRGRLTAIFEDTQIFYRENETLRAAVEKSMKESVIYEEGKIIDIPVLSDKEGKVAVSGHRSFEAAMKVHKVYPDAKIAVLNFASATSPGGGVLSGSGAQEESLCRCSTLYPCLIQDRMWKAYYGRNIAYGDNLHSDTVIYSPGIIVCKTDESYPERMDEKDWIPVDVITCAAPNLRHNFNNRFNTEYGERPQIDEDGLQQRHEKEGSTSSEQLSQTE